MPRRRSRTRASGIALACALLAAPAAAWSAPSALARPAASLAPVPNGFVGTVVDGPLFPDTGDRVDLAHQLDVMVASGVESLRVEFDWASAQPYASWSDVPPADQSRFVDVGGRPTSFAATDRLVGLAAQRGLTVLPDILNAPAWDGELHAGAIVTIPKADGPYASFAQALVRRYGPRGSFWQGRSPKLPVRMWQIWNEPNITPFWPVQPFQSRYLGLLRAARAAIKSADPGAQIVLAGMPNYSWRQLAGIYRFPGARRLFDVVAIHPYTRDAQGVITILTKARQVMDAAGDARKPIIADEISWPSSSGKTAHTLGFDFATTEAGQARKLGQLLPLLARDRVSLGLLGFYYYTWAGDEIRDGLAFSFAGLFRFQSGQFVAKPAFWMFRRDSLAMERCRVKGRRATVCLRRDRRSALSPRRTR